MVMSQNDNQPIAAVSECLQTEVVGVTVCEYAKISATLRHAPQHMRAAAFLEVDLDLGIRINEGAYIDRQALHDGRPVRRDPDMPLGAIRMFGHIAYQPLDAVDYRPCMRV